MPRRVDVEDLKLGEGSSAERGSIVTVSYDGYLRKGECFQRDVTTTFKMGERRVIPGLEYGVEGMKVGGERRIKVPPHLAYGAAGVEGVVPPNALLILQVRLVEVKS